MLVLSRKIGEVVILPSCGVTVTVVATRGKRVRLGIVAPPNTSVRRSEVPAATGEAREDPRGSSGATDCCEESELPPGGREPDPL